MDDKALDLRFTHEQSRWRPISAERRNLQPAKGNLHLRSAPRLIGTCDGSVFGNAALHTRRPAWLRATCFPRENVIVTRNDRGLLQSHRVSDMPLTDALIATAVFVVSIVLHLFCRRRADDRRLRKMKIVADAKRRSLQHAPALLRWGNIHIPCKRFPRELLEHRKSKPFGCRCG